MRHLALLTLLTLAVLPSVRLCLAQTPNVVPGLPGADLPSGSKFPTQRAQLSDLVDDTEVPAEAATESTPAPAASGDWFGARKALEDDGITLRANITQFAQGITTGGLEPDFAYGLKMDYFAVIEGAKLLGWEGAYLNLHGESRFGQSVDADLGSFSLANLAMAFPKPNGAASALTNAQFFQFIRPDLVISAGKINTVDGENIHPFLGGYGTDRFQNAAFIISNLVHSHLFPYSTPGAMVVYMPDLEPVLTLMVLDTSGRPDTPGLSRMFSNGATIFTQARLPVRPLGLRGHRFFEFAYGTGRFTPLSDDDYIILPGPPLAGIRRSGSWSMNVGFDQLLWADPDDPDRGWGLFGNLGLADESTNPIRWMATIGLAGASPLRRRPHDSFGLAYYYLAPSGDLERELATTDPIRNEQGAEAYYDARLTPWFHLTFSLQAIDPAELRADSALIAGIRAKIVF